MPDSIFCSLLMGLDWVVIVESEKAVHGGLFIIMFSPILQWLLDSPKQKRKDLS